MSFNIVKSDGSLEKVAGLANSEKINEMYAAFPSGASSTNKLLSYKSLQLYANYQSNSTRVVRIEYSNNLSTRLHLITEPGAALREVFIQLATGTPFVTVYDIGVSSAFTVKTGLVSNHRVVYINVGTADGSVIINQDDVPTDGYSNLILPTVTVTDTSDAEWTNATTITPIKLRPISSVTAGSNAPVTSGGVANEINPELTVTFTPASGLKSGNVTLTACKKIGDGLAVVSGYINSSSVLTVSAYQSNLGTLGILSKTVLGANPTSLFLWAQGQTPQCAACTWKSTGSWMAVPFGDGDVTLSEDAWFNAVVRYQ